MLPQSAIEILLQCLNGTAAEAGAAPATKAGAAPIVKASSAIGASSRLSRTASL